MLQQTPRAVTVAPPSAVTSPPEVAVNAVIFVAIATVTVGAVISSILQFSKMGNSSPAKSTLEIADLIFIDFENLITNLITLSYWFKNFPARLGFRYCPFF